MSGDVSIRKRLIAITGGNLRNFHIYFSGHQDFFPKECVGGSNRKNGVAHIVKLIVAGLDNPVETDIASNGKNGGSRNFFRKRDWVRLFFNKHQIREGDVIAIERISTYHYGIAPCDAKSVHQYPATFSFSDAPEDIGPTIIELFAGAGGMVLGFKNAGSICEKQ